MRRRKSADTWCQVNLRIRESLRAELAAAAKEHEVSFNQEVRRRLADSLEEKARRSLESLATNLEHKSRDIELATRRFEDLHKAMMERLGPSFVSQAITEYQEAKSKTQAPQQEQKRRGRA
jgi:predicted HicB family RNase H-like nuclease